MSEPEPEPEPASRPGPEPQPADPEPLVDLEALSHAVPLPDEEATAQAGAALAGSGLPADAFGRLRELAGWLAGVQGRCPTRRLERVRLVVVAGDHGVREARVSAQSGGATAEAVRGIVAGDAAVSVLADVVGAGVRVVDLSVDDDLDGVPAEVTRYRIRRGSGRIDREDALERAEAERAFRAGMDVADEEVDAGADLLLLGSVGVASTTPAAVLAALLTRTEVVEVVGRGSGIDDPGWMRKTAAVRDAARRGRPLVADRIGLLATVAGADVAALTGFLVQAAARRTPVVIDGMVVAAAALLAQRVAYRSPRWWLAGDSSPEAGHRAALDRLDLVPVVDHGLRLGSGAGALLAVPALRAASRLLPELRVAGSH